MAELLTEESRFRAWADIYPHARKFGEWECDYESWPSFYDAVLGFTAEQQFESWSQSEVQAVLYAIARDNEMQHLAREIRTRHPELIPKLARAAILMGERDDRWQLAEELGNFGIASEQLLLELAQDEDEYVRRRSLGSLARIGSSSVETIALAAWHRPDESQEHARMMALQCLEEIGSSYFEPLLAEAKRDERQYLRGYAEGILRERSAAQNPTGE